MATTSKNDTPDPRMTGTDSKDLLAVIASGSLRHAAARRELYRRGEESGILEIDLKFRNSMEGGML